MLTKHHCVYHLKSRNCAPGWRQSPNYFFCLCRMQSGTTTTRQKLQRLPALSHVAWSLVLVAAPLQQGLVHLTGTSRSAHIVLLPCIHSFPGCMISNLSWAAIRHNNLLGSGVTCWCKASTTNQHMQHSITTLGNSNVLGVCTHMMQLSMLYFPLCSLCKL